MDRCRLAHMMSPIRVFTQHAILSMTIALTIYQPTYLHNAALGRRLKHEKSVTGKKTQRTCGTKDDCAASPPPGVDVRVITKVCEYACESAHEFIHARLCAC